MSKTTRKRPAAATSNVINLDAYRAAKGLSPTPLALARAAILAAANLLDDEGRCPHARSRLRRKSAATRRAPTLAPRAPRDLRRACADDLID